MKSLFAMLASAVFAVSVQASEMKLVEGELQFNQGEYHVAGTKLTGLSLTELRSYEGKTVKVAGESTAKGLEIYKVFVKTDNGFETSYDWDVVNQEYYAN